MRLIKITMLSLLIGLMAAGSTLAADVQCTTADKSTWLAPAQVKGMLEQHGFTNVGTVKPNDRKCYVVRATDNSGTTRTLYLDPTDGALRAME